MKKTLFLISICILNFSVNAQKDFRPGFIIKTEGDTTRGFVAYQSNEKSENECFFRSTKKGTTEEYTPAQIIAFGYENGKFYESKVIYELTKPGSVLSGNQGEVFLEALLKGKLSLFRYRSGFIFEKENELVLVRGRKMIEGRTTGEIAVTDNSQARIVAGLISDCNKSLLDFDKFKIAERYLTELVGAYNECSGTTFIEIKENIPWSLTQTKLFAGFGSSQINFSSTTASSRYVTEADFESPSYFQLGLEFNFRFPRVSEKTSWILGLQYNQAVTFEATTAFNDNRQIENVIFELSSIGIPVGLRLNSPTTRSPYLALGTTVKLNTKGTAIRNRSITNGGSTINETLEPFDMKSVQIGIWIGLALEFDISESKKASFEFRYENTNGIVGTTADQQFDLNSNITNLQLIFGVWL